MNVSKYNHIILGLGNPGAEYAHTRHNAGRSAVQLFVKINGFSAFAEMSRLKALTSNGTFGKQQLLLALPETFMNKSGITMRALKLPSKKQISEKLIVLHDDLDLPLGSIKITKNRGSAGHKGVENILYAAKTKDITRIRIGIAKLSDIKKRQSTATVQKIVIGTLSLEDKALLQKGIKKAAEALGAVVTDGIAKAMNEFN